MHVATPSDSNIRGKEHEKIEEDQGLRRVWEKRCRVKIKMVPVVTATLEAETHKFGRRAPADSRNNI